MKLPKRRDAPGTAPGTIITDPNAAQTVIRVVGFNQHKLKECTLREPEELRHFMRDWEQVWVDVDGLGNGDTLAALGELFRIHRLTLEDVVNTHQRPKTELYGEQIFLVTRALMAQEPFATQQASLILGKGFVLTFDESGGDPYEPVRKRLRESRGRLREFGCDHLFYALLDSLIDGYFPRLDMLAETLDDVEERVLERAAPKILGQLHEIRHELLALRRIMHATRDAVNVLIRDSGSLVSADTRLYLRDCYDHTVQLVDILESQREMAASIMEIYLSSASNRMNQIMKVLTIITTLFIPLTFVVGVYGMNFDPDTSPWNMPELRAAYGYPIVLGLMAATAVLELYVFWRLGWFQDSAYLPAPGKK